MSGAGLPCVLRATADSSTSGCTAPTTSTCTPVPTPTPTCGGGRTGSREWDRAGQDVFAYFNNDGDANAVRNARTLRALLD